jgi:MurNAc alpha-1-phosphate uridylyltransferase
MRPLTEHCPKPLLSAGGQPLIEHTIIALRAAGVTELVINHAWLGQQIESWLGDGSCLSVSIQYSPEGEPLETAGGIKKALPLLEAGSAKPDSPFIVVNGDIWTDYDFSKLTSFRMPPDTLAHLVMVSNPQHNPLGDFIALNAQTTGCFTLLPKSTHLTSPTLTYTGIGIYRPAMFATVPAVVYPLAPVLREAMSERRVSGESFAGQWFDIGTPEKLSWLDQHLRRQ